MIVPLIEFETCIRGMFTERFTEKSILDALAITGISYTLGHIVAGLSSMILERGVLKITHGYPGSQVFATKPMNRCWLLSSLLWILPGRCYSYPTQFVERYFQLYNKIFRQHVVSTEEARVADDLFWNSSLYASVHHPVGFRIAQHFVELYGFARNTCMSIIIVAFYPLLPGWSLRFSLNYFIPNWAWVLGTLVAAYFMYGNYTKLLRRQNDHIFRSFFVAASEEDAKLDKTNEIILPSSRS